MTQRVAENEPLAIVGIGCRLPGGVASPAEFWNLLKQGRCGIREIPPDRWNVDLLYDKNPGAIGKARTKWGGFIDGIRDFDAEFFGISPREAEAMDPQQRQLLSVVWEAFEDAGIAADRVKGSNGAVFVGVSGTDYTQIQRFRRTGENVHAGTGGAMSIIANRISHKFDLKGPSAAVDTACSSSLVATDMACNAIWSGVSDIAIAGGTSALLDPGVFINFSKANMMSPTGRIRTFDADADGYVRGEGAGAVIIKRLSHAIEDGDHVYAVLRSTCVNQDGQTSTITVPSAEAQSEMLSEACRRAGLTPSDVDYVEAHGTGTPVGDPIEATAIGKVFGVERNRRRAIIVGAGKTNTGHLESAAGITGLIKTALCLEQREIPRNINFKRANPNIPFDDLGLSLPLEHSAWAADSGRPRRAAVNSFGFGGTNACAVLEEAPKANGAYAAKRHPYRKYHFIPFGAQSDKALAKIADNLSGHLKAQGDLAKSVPEMGANLALRRSHLTFRAAVLAESPEEVAASLRRAARSIGAEDKQKPEPGVILGRRSADQRLAFAFAGQGGQWWGMAQGLLREDPVFAAVVDEFDALYKEQSGWSIKEELLKGKADSQINRTLYTQPGLFVLQIGLVARWRAWGIEPDMVIGHSVGEMAAAHTAGILSTADAARIIYARSTLQSRLEGKGGIATVALSREEMEANLSDWGLTLVEIAAVNGPSMVNIAGDVEALNDAVERLRAKYGEDFFVRVLKVDYAPHSFHMEPLREEFLAAVANVRPSPSKVPMISTVSGRVTPGQTVDGVYWWRNARDAVLFEPALREAMRAGATAFVEIGPHTNLAAMISGVLAETGGTALTVPSLKREEPHDRTLLSGLATLYVNGIEPDWRAFYGEHVARAALPLYPFEARPHWIESEESRNALYAPRPHPLLGGRTLAPTPVWVSELTLEEHKFLADHVIDGSVVFPGTGYLEIMFAAGVELFGDGAIELENVEILEAMTLTNERNEMVQTVFEPSRSRISIYSRQRGSNLDWTLRARAVLRSVPMLDDQGARAPKPPRGTPVTAAQLYRRVARRGYVYGPDFQGARKLWHGKSSAVALVERRHLAGKEMHFHPALFDSALHVGFGIDAGVGSAATEDKLYLPVRIERVILNRRPVEGTLWSLSDSVKMDAFGSVTDVTVLDETGRVLVRVDGFTTRAIPFRAKNAPKSATLPTSYLVEEWTETEPRLAAGARPGRGQNWLVFADGKGLGSSIADSLRKAGARCAVVGIGKAFKRLDDDRFEIDPTDSEQYDRVLAALGRRRKLAGIAFAWPLALAADNKGFDVASLRRNESRSTIAALNLLQALTRAGGTAPRLWLLSQGALPVGSGKPAGSKLARAMADAPLAGFARTALTEHADYRCTLLDLDPTVSEAAHQAAQAAGVLLGGTDETEIALREHSWFVPRLRDLEESALPPRSAPALSRDGFRHYRLAMTSPGDLDHLHLVETPALKPGRGELLVAVKAGGLNFRDVMAATGLLPPDAEDGAAWETLGLECAGLVTAVGPGVRGFKPGDRIMGSAKGCFRSQIVVPASSVHRMPRRMSYVEAATVPSAFATAYYGLVRLARIRKGDTVLIHLGTGGVGLAAIQIARHFGAEVISTAGSPSKRAYLRQIGVKHVFDSRSLSFAEDVRRVTKGRGVDIVLNALAGEAIPLAVGVLAPNGRFIEIGKRDIYGDSALGLRALRKNGSFFVLDMARMDQDDPQAVQEVFEEMLTLFERGRLKPLPTHTFPAGQMREAFSTMAQARHIGKVVIDFDTDALDVDLSTALPLSLPADGGWLVTGGLGGFGAEVARYLATHGARHLYLLGRSGGDRPEAKALLADLAKQGVKAHAIAADVTNRADLDAVLARMARDKVALRGVVHSAMVLDDGFINQLDADRMMRVMAPKIVGAWNLHQATAGIELDHFVMFSSMAAVLGSSGQANYVAGNRFLDLLAAQRRRLGLPAVTVNWGALGGAGAVQRDKAILKYLKTMGMPPLSLEEALTGLGVALRKSAPAVGCCKVDWQALGRANPAVRQLRRFSDVATEGGGASGGGKVRTELLAAKGADRQKLLKDYLTQQIARVLKVDAGKIEAARPLNELGLDSLTSFQLKNRIENEIAITLPVGKFLQKPTVESLAVTIGEVLETSGSERKEEAKGAETKAGGRVLSTRQEWAWRTLRRDGPIERYKLLELAGAIAIDADLDLERLDTAFRDTIAAHDTLRSYFPERDGDPTIELWPASSFRLEVVDAADQPEAQFLAELQKAVDRPHDLERDRLVSLRAYRRGGSRTVLLVRAHHILLDGHAFASMIREIFERYFGVHGVSGGGEAKSDDFFAYARWQRQRTEGEIGAKEDAFWADYLRDMGPPVNLARGKRAGNPRGVGASARRFIASESELPVRAAARKLGVSLHVLMTGAAHALLMGFGERDEMLISSSYANRENAEHERIVGWLNNVTLLRTRIEPDLPFRSHLARVAAGFAEVLPHSSHPYHLMQKAGDSTNPGGLPERHFGVYMNWPDNMERAGFERIFLTAPGTVHRFGDIQVSLLPVLPSGMGHFINDAMIFYQEMEGSLLINFLYAVDLMKPEEAEALVDRYLDILRRAIDEPDMPLRALAAPK
ncbi:MAG: SDR family NAD(P)-dependent oxidoreductase [Reyranellaceae bacterium]